MMYVDGKTKVYGILGWPVEHSLSPLLHNRGFRHHRLNSIYVPFPVEKTDRNIKKNLLKIGISGLSVTIPHKKWVAEVADQKDRLTKYCHAANTIINKENRWHAYNTDGKGALMAMESILGDLSQKNFLLIGYGGAATAVAHSLLLEGLPNSLFISGRDVKKKLLFVNSLRKAHPAYQTAIKTVEEKDLNPDEVDIIIHTTSIGMRGGPQGMPLSEKFIQKKHGIFDIVYTPKKTLLLDHARKKGAKIVPGFLMLLEQAYLQFELFTGKKPPQKKMKRELLRYLKN